MTALQAALDRLRSADAALCAAVGNPRSLRPGRARATPLEQLGRELLDEQMPSEQLHAFATGLAGIVDAQLRHFPETLFWDVDFLAAELSDVAAAPLRGLCEEIIALQAQYGRGSVLAFRYGHDFIYGFDWAKWVMRDPSARREARPFSPRFIEYLRARGEELEDLIERDDDKYPKLPDGRPRNPFGFSREPDHEDVLFRDLAAHDLVPVQTWDPAATPRADRPFAALRAERAAHLGVPSRLDE